MKIINLPAHRRVILGRNITLVAGIIYSTAQAIYYGTVHPESLTAAQRVVTADGAAVGAVSGLWAAAAVLCVVDMVNRHTRHGLSVITGLAFAWGLAYATLWALGGCTDLRLLGSAIGWATPALLIFGFLLKVTALQDMLAHPRAAP